MTGWDDDSGFDDDAEERQYRSDIKARNKHGNKCPHQHMHFCPLYVVGHDGALGPKFTCIDDMARPCLVKRGKMNYKKTLAELTIVDPRLVANCSFAEIGELAQEQRARNMRAAGIH